MKVHPLPVAMKNGQLIPVAEATIPVAASSLYAALGVYETVEVVNHHPFRLDQHLARLTASAEASSLPLPLPANTLREWIPPLLAANNVRDTLLRIVLVDVGDGDGVYYLYLMRPPNYPPEWYRTGVPVITFRGERAFPLIKSLNTLVPGLARRQAQQAGAHDALLVNRDGYITEGTNCNVFAVVDGTLITAPYGAALEGVTLGIVLELASVLGIPIERRPMPVHEIPRWEEAFLTSTRRHILPICRVDQHPLQVGPITRRLMEAFDRLWRQEVEATPV